MVSPLLLSRCMRRPLSPSALARSTRSTNRHLHLRSISILSGLGRLAGRTAGRGVMGLGVGAGALTWAEWKVDGKGSFQLSILLSRMGTEKQVEIE